MFLDAAWPGGDLPALRRLDPTSPEPLAVAFSGGGDSLALLRLTLAWARTRGRPVLALTVDHGLQAAGADWARMAARAAQRLGASHRTLTWTGAKPSTGLPAAARHARHALIAEAARAAGARVVLMGHTADDLMEAALMRGAGSTTPSPREWSPSPVWPSGRGLFLLRPLLGIRRADLRTWLRSLGETWIDDPANDDLRYARARARQTLSDDTVLEGADAPPAPLCLARVRQGEGGDLTLPLADLTHRLFSAAILCAAGTDRPPRTHAIDGLLARLAEGVALTATLAATLAGARIEFSGGEVRLCREPGEFGRAGLIAAPLPPESVFDGRFELTAARPGLTIQPLRGLAGRLPKAERAALRKLPPRVRPTLPAVVWPDGSVSSPILAQGGAVRARPLALSRLQHALGAIEDEAALWRVAKWARAS